MSDTYLFILMVLAVVPSLVHLPYMFWSARWYDLSIFCTHVWTYIFFINRLRDFRPLPLLVRDLRDLVAARVADQRMRGTGGASVSYRPGVVDIANLP